MKTWKILKKEGSKKQNLEIADIVKILLNNRGFATQKEINSFLYPDITTISLESVGIEKKEFVKFKKRLESANSGKERIVIFGDYDVDGICASAILWECLYLKNKNAIPYIPDRIDEGYGLSKKGIDNVLLKNPDTKIIITVDNGIVANDAVAYANTKGIDVIITDHHVKGKKDPQAFCILHTTKLCGAGIAWVLTKELQFENEKKTNKRLELATLATIADLVPLKNANRTIVKEGLEILKNTKRVGLLELFKEAGLDPSNINVYAIGHVIAPRLNATGRIQSAMNALRLLCTGDINRAVELAHMLGGVNRERQGMTEESVSHARLLALEGTSPHITVVADKSYNPGVIGLVASGLVEVYYRPAIAIAVDDEISKGSARSIVGVNIIELIRSVPEHILEAGGHPMAAGFSIKTEKIQDFILAISQKAEKVVTDELLKRVLTIDIVIPFSVISEKLFEGLSDLRPFGMENPEPVFATEKVAVLEVRKIGQAQNHLKLKLEKEGKVLDAVAFKMADKDISTGDTIDIAYTIDENVWNGKTSLQLKLRDIKSEI